MPTMGRKPIKLSDHFRRIIAEGGKSRYRIWQETGVGQETLSRFIAGSSLSTNALDKVVGCLGLKIVVQKTSKTRHEVSKPTALVITEGQTSAKGAVEVQKPTAPRTWRRMASLARDATDALDAGRLEQARGYMDTIRAVALEAIARH
jgi:hypothetical protein